LFTCAAKDPAEPCLGAALTTVEFIDQTSDHHPQASRLQP
jgi:hypothetical protein